MPSQQHYLLLVNRDSTTEVLKEERNAGEVTKVRSWNESAISWNLTRHASPIFKGILPRQTQVSCRFILYF